MPHTCFRSLDLLADSLLDCFLLCLFNSRSSCQVIKKLRKSSSASARHIKENMLGRIAKSCKNMSINKSLARQMPHERIKHLSNPSGPCYLQIGNDQSKGKLTPSHDHYFLKLLFSVFWGTVYLKEKGVSKVYFLRKHTLSVESIILRALSTQMSKWLITTMW